MRERVFSENGLDCFSQHAYLKRDGLCSSLEKYIQNPVFWVVGGAGYGKTQAVYMFLKEYDALTTWIQVTMLDNFGQVFWDKLIRGISHHHEELASKLEMLGFPDDETKFGSFLSCAMENMNPNLHSYRHQVIVFDNFHLLHDKKTLHFIEKLINAGIPGLSLVFISRKEPDINLAGLRAKEQASMIDEQDLCFSESEIAAYFEMQDIHMPSQFIWKIHQNTEGWIMAIRLMELSIQSGVEHKEYAITAMKLNVYKHMENEIFMHLPTKVQMFLIKISLLDSLPMELVIELSENDDCLMEAMGQIHSFIRLDSLSNLYHVHHLFLEFLRQKQNMLTREEKAECYEKAAGWYVLRGYIMEAIACYGKAENYEGILKIAFSWPYASCEQGALVIDIMDNTQRELCQWDPMVALMHAKAQWFVGKTEAYLQESQAIIKMCETLPETWENRRTLAEVYLSTGISRYYLSNHTNSLQFAKYMIRAYELMQGEPVTLKANYGFQDVGAYVCRIGSENQEAMESYIEEYIEAVKTASRYASQIVPGCMYGMDDLTQAELAYFKNSLKEAGEFAAQALHKARGHHQQAIAIRAIFYLVRISLAEGSYSKAQKILKQLDLQLEAENAPIYKTLCDVVNGWFYSLIGQGDKVAGWVKDDFEHAELNKIASGVENLARLKFCLCEKKYHELLAFLKFQENMGAIKDFLLGKILIMATKAVCLYHTGKKSEAIESLEKAYDLAKSGDFTMQFIELGNHMVSLVKFTLKNHDCAIPEEWLKIILRKASTYAKRVSQVASEYRKAFNQETDQPLKLTQREIEFLNDIFHGLSRAEIALNYGLSPNYVKNRLQAIYAKLGAKNANDAIRIGLLRRLIE